MSGSPLIQIENLKKHYPVNKGFKDIFNKEKKFVKAIDGVDLTIDKGEILGLAGESGSGKTTTGEILVRLQDATDGTITIDGHPLNSKDKQAQKSFRKEVQMIFQDPYETLNPRFDVFETIAEPLRIHGLKDKKMLYEKVMEVLEIAELKPAAHYVHRYPHELSGGQRQRVAIARGIVVEPKVLVADEPVSMLDVSIRADILNLLKDLRKKMGLTMLYVSHDLSTIKYLCDRIAIMYLGKIMEIGPVDEVVRNPQHPYTQVLLSAVPVADPTYEKKRILIDDEAPDQINLPEGCRFGPRCPYVKEACKTCNHDYTEVSQGHQHACIFAKEEQIKNEDH
ncbi:peptide/nickel transport system ATP-binding protein [Tindallia magadiensis]|uniref:Peptide/nickel transport system ATP-binding protein n=1 Tax=Tindallia magadiensis TaxID=69895 RepID=A0A1I3DA31_9FIRM|nr:ABC transporter ATP-binding protein [Tindallia magadiensis]SFH83543.1 peptide/nickel transport system ATP-binding protein [Tindallia magadiensis]